ncbi:MAG: 2-oxoacid:acceptor oxidoreductase subunit alpha [Thermoplasmatota archaeon]
MENIEDRYMSGRHFMLGNYAVVEGALAAGCEFFAGYPITPANEIAERMSERLPTVGGKFLQSEDELCSIYSVTGASLCGAKAMTATASAGFNYMQEGIGYATAVEAPSVIVDVQRCRGENYATQSDVMQMRWGASGDYEMVVLAPSSVQELFDHTVEAFNIAEKYRIPVIVMSETTIALMREDLTIPEPGEIDIERRKSPEVPPEEFKPFKPDEKGVPPMPEFGEGYKTLYSLNPHDEEGDIHWDPDVFEKMYERVTGKIQNNLDDISMVDEYQTDDAEVILVAYGSECRPAIDAMKRARKDGKKVGLLKLGTVWPVPEKQLKEAADQASVIFSIEMNIGKYSREVERVCAPHCEVRRVTKNRGVIHTANEIYSSVKEVL